MCLVLSGSWCCRVGGAQCVCVGWGGGGGVIITFPFKGCYSGIYLVHLPQQMPPRGEQTLLASAWPPSRQSVSHLFMWSACLCLAPCWHRPGRAAHDHTGPTALPGPVPCSSPPSLKLPGAPAAGSPPRVSGVPEPHQDRESETESFIISQGSDWFCETRVNHWGPECLFFSHKCSLTPP